MQQMKDLAQGLVFLMLACAVVYAVGHMKASMYNRHTAGPKITWYEGLFGNFTINGGHK